MDATRGWRPSAGPGGRPRSVPPEGWRPSARAWGAHMVAENITRPAMRAPVHVISFEPTLRCHMDHAHHATKMKLAQRQIEFQEARIQPRIAPKGQSPVPEGQKGQNPNHKVPGTLTFRSWVHFLSRFAQEARMGQNPTEPPEARIQSRTLQVATVQATMQEAKSKSRTSRFPFLGT